MIASIGNRKLKAGERYVLTEWGRVIHKTTPGWPYTICGYRYVKALNKFDMDRNKKNLCNGCFQHG